MWGIPSFLYNRAPITNEKIEAISIVEKIIAAAKSMVGQRETHDNLAFQNPYFQKQMQAVGWLPGEAWCCFFAELIWKKAFEGHPLLPELDKLFSGSSVQTWRNFANSGKFETGQVPKPGAICIYQFGKSAQGHTVLVMPVITTTTFESVEGNSNSDGGREGIEVADRTGDHARHWKEGGLPFSEHGLNQLGFIYAPAA